MDKIAANIAAHFSNIRILFGGGQVMTCPDELNCIHDVSNMRIRTFVDDRANLRTDCEKVGSDLKKAVKEKKEEIANN